MSPMQARSRVDDRDLREFHREPQTPESPGVVEEIDLAEKRQLLCGGRPAPVPDNGIDDLPVLGDDAAVWEECLKLRLQWPDLVADSLAVLLTVDKKFGRDVPLPEEMAERTRGKLALHMDEVSVQGQYIADFDRAGLTTHSYSLLVEQEAVNGFGCKIVVLAFFNLNELTVLARSY